MKLYKYLLAVIALLGACISAMADGVTLPDPTTITTAVQAPAAGALTWVISISTVVAIFGYVMWLVRKKRG
jgi:hypothetical protein